MIILKSILISLSFTFAQSYEEKPNIPIFSINGKSTIIVDCFSKKENSWKRHFLTQTKHPKIFTSSGSSQSKGFSFVVSLLRSENTLEVTRKKTKYMSELTVETYGTECGFSQGSSNIYCSIFLGEISEN